MVFPEWKIYTFTIFELRSSYFFKAITEEENVPVVFRLFTFIFYEQLNLPTGLLWSVLDPSLTFLPNTNSETFPSDSSGAGVKAAFTDLPDRWHAWPACCSAGVKDCTSMGIMDARDGCSQGDNQSRKICACISIPTYGSKGALGSGECWSMIHHLHIKQKLCTLC